MLFLLKTGNEDFVHKGITYKAEQIIETNVNLCKRYKKSEYKFERIIGGTFQTVRIMSDGTKVIKKRKPNWNLGKKFRKVGNSLSTTRFVQIRTKEEKTKSERKTEMKTEMKKVITYTDGTQETSVRDTSKDCLAADSPLDGVRHGNTILYADGSSCETGNFGKVIHKPASLTGEFPLRRLVAILRYWQIIHLRKTNEFNWIKARLEQQGRTFEIRSLTYEVGNENFYFLKREGKSTDALERLSELKDEIQEAFEMYKKAEAAVEEANPKSIPAQATRITIEEAKRQQQFKDRIRGIESGERIKQPQRSSRR